MSEQAEFIEIPQIKRSANEPRPQTVRAFANEEKLTRHIQDHVLKPPEQLAWAKVLETMACDVTHCRTPYLAHTAKAISQGMMFRWYWYGNERYNDGGHQARRWTWHALGSTGVEAIFTEHVVVSAMLVAHSASVGDRPEITEQESDETRTEVAPLIEEMRKRGLPDSYTKRITEQFVIFAVNFRKFRRRYRGKKLDGDVLGPTDFLEQNQFQFWDWFAKRS